MANLQDIIPSFFVGPGGKRLTPEQIAQRQELAQSLLAQATDTSPNAGGVASILSKGLAGFRAGRDSRMADNATTNNAESSRLSIANMLGGLSGQSGTSGVGAGDTAMLGGVPATAPADPVSDRVSTSHAPTKLDGSKQSFIDTLLPAAMEASQRTGVDPRIIVAQAAQETGWGRSAPGNNFFGIKSHGKGGGQSFNTHEYINGKRVNINDSFRTFDSPADSVAGYADFLLSNPRYKSLMGAQGLDAQLSALQASGYATDPNYSQSVGSIARGIPLPEMTAYAPQTQQGGALVAAPFQDEGMPIGGAVLADESSFSPEDRARLAEMRGPALRAVPYSGPGAYLDNPRAPAVPQNNPTIWGGNMDPNDPSTIPAMAGGTMDVIQGQPGAFPQAPGQQQRGGINPAIIEALSNPYASPQERQIASSLLGQQMQQQQAMQDQQRAQQEQAMVMQQRQQLAQSMGINPAMATDDNAWKAAIDQSTRNRNTVTVGNTVYDANTGQPVIQGTQERFSTITGPQAQQLGLDPNKAYNVGPDGKVSPIGENGVTVNVGGGEKLDEEFAKLDAKSLADVSTAGMSAQRNLGRIDQLERLLSQSPSGFSGLAAQRAGEWGINTEGLDSLQAAQAAINSLVPEQRPAGSGPMSDADLELFKQSLPRIINTENGNRMIINTMRGIAQYDAEGANIVQRFRKGELSRAEAFDAMQNRVNPLASFSAQAEQPTSATNIGKKTSTGVTWSID